MDVPCDAAFTEAQARSYFVDVISGIEYCKYLRSGIWVLIVLDVQYSLNEVEAQSSYILSLDIRNNSF